MMKQNSDLYEKKLSEARQITRLIKSLPGSCDHHIDFPALNDNGEIVWNLTPRNISRLSAAKFVRLGTRRELGQNQKLHFLGACMKKLQRNKRDDTVRREAHVWYVRVDM